MDAHLTGAVAPGLAAPMSAEITRPANAASLASGAEPHARLTPQKTEVLAGQVAQDSGVDVQTVPRNFIARSTATEAQRARIVAMLRTGEKSTFDFRRAGIMQSSTRIFELRARGFVVPTVARRDMFDAEGYRHARVAVYALASEPDEQT